MKTAHEFLKEKSTTSDIIDGVEFFYWISDKDLIEFAQMHVTEALKQAQYKCIPSRMYETIAESYPLENIK